jgi:hypothetical protein
VKKVPLTVQKALSLDIFTRCRLLTADEGLNNSIYWVNILEILDDLSHLEPGEFLITTAHGLQSLGTKRQKEMVELFAERRLAAVAIQTGHYIDTIPSTLIELFRECQIPLIEVPPDISFKSITRALLLLLLKAENEETGTQKTAKDKDHRQLRYEAMLNTWCRLTEGVDPVLLNQNFLDLELTTDYDYWLCRLAATEQDRNRTPFPLITEELLLEELSYKLFQLMEQRHIPFLIGTTGSNLTLLLQPLPDSSSGDNMIQYSRRILEELRLICPKLDIFLGLSKGHSNFNSWEKAVEQAEKALWAATLGLSKQNGYSNYSTLGLLKLIFAIEKTDILEDQLNETLKPLFEYDERTNGALLQTLKTYIKYHNIKTAAEELYVHRHTMKYRLNQIRKLTGYNPEETAALIILSESMIIYDYLKARGLNPF